jgi:hypothetical protein
MTHLPISICRLPRHSQLLVLKPRPRIELLADLSHQVGEINAVELYLLINDIGSRNCKQIFEKPRRRFALYRYCGERISVLLRGPFFAECKTRRRQHDRDGGTEIVRQVACTVEGKMYRVADPRPIFPRGK